MAAALPAGAWAQPVVGPYVSLGAGADFMQNLQFHPVEGFMPEPRAYRMDVGPAGVVALGYGLGYGLRVEIEGDYSYNHVRGVTFPVALRAGGYVQQYGGFANVMADLPVALPFGVAPYLGAGAGYRRLELGGVSSSLPGFVSVESDETRGTFAYQGIAGVAAPLPFLPGLAMTAEYRMIGLGDDLTYPRRIGNGTERNVNVSNVFNHEVLIGLRLAFGVPVPPPPPPVPTPAAVPAPAAARTYLVFFDWDKSELTERARQIVAEAAQASTRVQTTRIEVNGYTDLSGTATYNMALSVRRADAVAAELVRDGVSRSEIGVQGFGEAHPLVPTAQGVREPQNRRVEIILK